MKPIKIQQLFQSGRINTIAEDANSAVSSNSISQSSEKSNPFSKENQLFSLKKNSDYNYIKLFAEQIDDWKQGKIPQRDSLLVGGTPELFKKIGFNALPMTINQKHVDYAINGIRDIDHSLGEIFMKQLPDIIKDHGKNGLTDHSMADDNDIARIEYVINNYDSVELLDDISKEYRDKKQ